MEHVHDQGIAMMRILGRVYPVPNARTVVQFTDPVLGACRTLFLHERILSLPYRTVFPWSRLPHRDW